MTAPSNQKTPFRCAGKRKCGETVSCGKLHQDDKAVVDEAARALFLIDPDFSLEYFLATEFYKDQAIGDQLESDLKTACIPAAMG